MPKSVCTEICADPDLIARFSYGVSDNEETREARNTQIKFITDCPRRDKYICKWEKDIEKWNR